MSIYRRKCDQCHTEFKRGIRIELSISKVSILSGEACWDPMEDEEHFATFCSAECMLSYVAQRLGIKDEE